MKDIKRILLIILMCFPLMLVNAEEKDTTKNEIEKIEIIQDAHYKADETLNTEGNFFGSAFYAGNNINSNSIIEGINFSAGNNVTIEGTQDYLITAGNNIYIKGNIKNDVVVAGNLIDITGDIGRDVIIAGTSVILSGNIGRNVKVYAADITIKGIIKGNIDIFADEIDIEEGAVVDGYLNCNDTADFEKNGKVTIGEVKTYKVTEKPDLVETIKSTIYKFLTDYINLLIVALVITYLLPKVFVTLNEEYTKNKVDDYIRLFVKGLLFLIVIPIVSIILLMSSVGLSLGLITLVLYFILSYISVILTGYIVGNLICCKLLKKENNTYINLLVGIFFIKLLELIPYVGGIVSVFSLFIGLGIILEKVIINKNRKHI